MRMSLLISLSVNFRTYRTFTNICHLLQEYTSRTQGTVSPCTTFIINDLPLHKNRQWSISVLCKFSSAITFICSSVSCLIYTMCISLNDSNNYLSLLLLLLTQNIDDDILGQRISDTIICSTSVLFFILSTNDLQGHSDDSVIRDSLPGYCWFWFSVSWAG